MALRKFDFPPAPATDKESEKRIEEISNIKENIEKDFNQLTRLLDNMVGRAEKEFEKEKVTDAIVTDWQTPYESFSNALEANNVEEALGHLDTMQINVEFDIAYRYYLYQSVSTDKWHKPAVELIKSMRDQLDKLKEYSNEELEQVPIDLKVKAFEPDPAWKEIEEQREEHLQTKAKKQEKIERGQVLQNALFMQETLEAYEEQLEKERQEKGEDVPKSDLEKEIEDELRKIKYRVLDELDRLYEAVQRGEDYEISIEETLSPALVMPEKKRRPSTRSKKIIIPKEISEAETIAPSVYEKKPKQKPRRKTG